MYCIKWRRADVWKSLPEDSEPTSSDEGEDDDDDNGPSALHSRIPRKAGLVHKKMLSEFSTVSSADAYCSEYSRELTFKIFWPRWRTFGNGASSCLKSAEIEEQRAPRAGV